MNGRHGRHRGSLLLGLLLWGFFASAGCSFHRDARQARDRADVPHGRRVVIRDEDGHDHHGYYDPNGDWHGGYYDDLHAFYTDVPDWGRGREQTARPEGPPQQYNRYGQDKSYEPDQR